jgi:hypothetical protein
MLLDTYSTWVGGIGDRLDFTGSLVKTYSRKTKYGYRHSLKFMSDEGNVYYWDTTVCPAISMSDKLRIRGTISELRTSKEGVKYTLLKYCKIDRVDEE